MHSGKDVLNGVRESAQLYGVAVTEAELSDIADRLSTLLAGLQTLWDYDLRDAGNPLYLDLRRT